MFDNIFSNDSIHTQPANKIERRVRAREEQRLMLGEDLGWQEAGREKRTSRPVKARLAGIFSNSKVFLQAVVGSISLSCFSRFVFNQRRLCSADSLTGQDDSPPNRFGEKQERHEQQPTR